MAETVQINSYWPSPKQQDFHSDPHKCRLLLGAYGAGKSFAMIWEVLHVAMEYPGARIVIFRKTYPALRDTTWRDFLTELGKLPPEFVESEKKTEGREEIVLPNGSTIIARCLDDWRKLGSAAFDFVVIDEAIEVSEAEFDMILKGRLRGKVGPRKMILATNPPNRNHWLYTRFVKGEPGKKVDPDLSVHKFSTYDNYSVCLLDHPGECERVIAPEYPNHKPIEGGTVIHHNLTPGYIEGLESKPENFRKRFLEGDWGYTAEGTPIFTEFSESRHVANLKPEPGITLYRGWDFGYRHPACVWIQALPTGHIHVLNELMGEDEDIESFARRVMVDHAHLYPNWPVTDYCDIAGTQKNDLGLTSVMVLRRLGIMPRFRKLRIWKTVEGMRDLISRTSLGVPLLRVNSTCIWTIEALSGGYIVHVNARSGEEEPKKDGTYDHIVDALRYALADVFFPSHAGRAVEFKPTRHAARYAV